MKKKVKVPYTLVRGDKEEHGELDAVLEDIVLEPGIREIIPCPFKRIKTKVKEKK